jgi:hypothetical protein
MRYCCYRCVAKRRILRNDYATLAEALLFFDQERTALVVDSENNEYYNKEDLKNAKGIGLQPGVKLDYEFTSDGQILEDSDRELSGTDTDNSESSAECDNQRDQLA